MDITTLFCEIDGFCKEFLPEKTSQITNNKVDDKKHVIIHIARVCR